MLQLQMHQVIVYHAHKGVYSARHLLSALLVNQGLL